MAVQTLLITYRVVLMHLHGGSIAILCHSFLHSPDHSRCNCGIGIRVGMRLTKIIQRKSPLVMCLSAEQTDAAMASMYVLQLDGARLNTWKTLRSIQTI